MSDLKDEWFAYDWQTVEDCSRDLLHFAYYLKQRADSGGGRLTPEDIKVNVLRAENILSRLKQTANNYH